MFWVELIIIYFSAITGFLVWAEKSINGYPPVISYVLLSVAALLFLDLRFSLGG